MKRHLSTQTRKRILSSLGLILFSVSFVLAQVLVKGTVKDNLGEGVPGASVQVKGTSQGTITDLDGKFAFSVPNKNATIVISFIPPPVKVDNEKWMFDIIRASFNQRRKTLANGLSNSDKIDLPKDVITEAIAKLGKGESVRGESLSLEEFAALSNDLWEKKGR